jgi:hypothetical protein
MDLQGVLTVEAGGARQLLGGGVDDHIAERHVRLVRGVGLHRTELLALRPAPDPG